MDFQLAMLLFVQKALTIEGRASRSEFWYAMLFQFLLAFAIQVAVAIPLLGIVFGVIGALLMLVLLIPTVTVAIRRMHDLDRSGWWILLLLVPVIGGLVFVFFALQPGTDGPNRFGHDPLGGLDRITTG